MNNEKPEWVRAIPVQHRQTIVDALIIYIRDCRRDMIRNVEHSTSINYRLHKAVDVLKEVSE